MIRNPFRKWWQFWKPKYIDVTKADIKQQFPLGTKIIVDGHEFTYAKMRDAKEERLSADTRM